MRKQTVWLLIIFLGVYSAFLMVSLGGYTLSFPKMLAQVGITVGIAPNPYNTLDAQLNQEKAQLDQQQADLAAREAGLVSSSKTETGSASPVPWYIIVLLGFITFLVLLNFYLDWRRFRRISQAVTPVVPSDSEKPKE